jgi:hypothetical protein
MKLELSRHMFENTEIIKFHKHPCSGSLVVPRGQIERWTDKKTDGYDEAKSRFLQFCESA